MEKAMIGIIGGADGPTKIYVTGTLGAWFPFLALLGAAVVGTVVEAEVGSVVEGLVVVLPVLGFSGQPLRVQTPPDI